MNLLFFWSCVIPYGEPLVSHISEEKIVEASVDFSPLYLKLDALLLGETDRFELHRLRACEQLLGKAKSWRSSEQRDVFIFVEQFLNKPAQESVELNTSEPIKEMEFSMESIPLEEKGKEQSDERIHQANALVESGNRLGAIALLAECRDLPCWSEVYVYWAQYSDMEFAQRVERIQSSTDTIEEKLLLWDKLGEEFSHPTYQARIEKQKQRIQNDQDTP